MPKRVEGLPVAETNDVMGTLVEIRIHPDLGMVGTLESVFIALGWPDFSCKSLSVRPQTSHSVPWQKD